MKVEKDFTQIENHGWQISGLSKNLVVATNGCIVADCEGYALLNDIERAANAQLIAAAPKMVELLITRLKELSGKLSDFPEEEDTVSWNFEYIRIKSVLTSAGIVITE